MLTEIKDIVKNAGNEILFGSPVRIKSSPHQTVFICYGVHADEKEGVYLLDGEGNWHGPLEETQVNAILVINSIYQRLKALVNKAA